MTLELTPIADPKDLLDAALIANPPRKVLWALLRHLLAPRAHSYAAHDLPDHLRKDVGLAPNRPPPRLWEHGL
ncbi:MAG: hypothetical protein AAFO58_10225 [Pseudomonadota bacterium]